MYLILLEKIVVQSENFCLVLIKPISFYNLHISWSLVVSLGGVFVWDYGVIFIIFYTLVTVEGRSAWSSLKKISMREKQETYNCRMKLT